MEFTDLIHDEYPDLPPPQNLPVFDGQGHISQEELGKMRLAFDELHLEKYSPPSSGYRHELIMASILRRLFQADAPLESLLLQQVNTISELSTRIEDAKTQHTQDKERLEANESMSINLVERVCTLPPLSPYTDTGDLSVDKHNLLQCLGAAYSRLSWLKAEILTLRSPSDTAIHTDNPIHPPLPSPSTMLPTTSTTTNKPTIDTSATSSPSFNSPAAWPDLNHPPRLTSSIASTSMAPAVAVDGLESLLTAAKRVLDEGDEHPGSSSILKKRRTDSRERSKTATPPLEENAFERTMSALDVLAEQAAAVTPTRSSSSEDIPVDVTPRARRGSSVQSTLSTVNAVDTKGKGPSQTPVKATSRVPTATPSASPSLVRPQVNVSPVPMTATAAPLRTVYNYLPLPDYRLFPAGPLRASPSGSPLPPPANYSMPFLPTMRPNGNVASPASAAKGKGRIAPPTMMPVMGVGVGMGVPVMGIGRGGGLIVNPYINVGRPAGSTTSATPPSTQMQSPGRSLAAAAAASMSLTPTGTVGRRGSKVTTFAASSALSSSTPTSPSFSTSTSFSAGPSRANSTSMPSVTTVDTMALSSGKGSGNVSPVLGTSVASTSSLVLMNGVTSLSPVDDEVPATPSKRGRGSRGGGGRGRGRGRGGRGAASTTTTASRGRGRGRGKKGSGEVVAHDVSAEAIETDSLDPTPPPSMPPPQEGHKMDIDPALFATSQSTPIPVPVPLPLSLEPPKPATSLPPPLVTPTRPSAHSESLMAR